MNDATAHAIGQLLKTQIRETDTGSTIEIRVGETSPSAGRKDLHRSDQGYRTAWFKTTWIREVAVLGSFKQQAVRLPTNDPGLNWVFVYAPHEGRAFNTPDQAKDAVQKALNFNVYTYAGEDQIVVYEGGVVLPEIHMPLAQDMIEQLSRFLNRPQQGPLSLSLVAAKSPTLEERLAALPQEDADADEAVRGLTPPQPERLQINGSMIFGLVYTPPEGGDTVIVMHGVLGEDAWVHERDTYTAF